MAQTGYYKALKTLGQIKEGAVGFVPPKGDVIVFRHKDIGLALHLTPSWMATLVERAPHDFEYLGTDFKYPD